MLRFWLLMPLLFSRAPEFRKPADFKQLPSVFRSQLERQGCTIPQDYWAKDKVNVISGFFAKPGQRDWAALCSVGGKSRIVVYWGGPASCGVALPETSDDSYRQSGGNGQSLYSRRIIATSARQIRKHARDHSSLPVKVDHQGIEDIFLEKASVVFYCHEGRWQQLQGAE
jgi:hypothetical protein